jgi:cytidylate kinase
MNEDRSVVNAMRAITVSREYGSGGGEIASRLAERLGWRLIDHEVVVAVAHELGVTEEEAEARDERMESLIARILSSMQLATPFGYVEASVVRASDTHSYRNALSKVVLAAAEGGHVVIVGRGSQLVLAGRRDVLHVRVVAPLEQRIAYVMQREGLDANTARSRIQVKDHDRMRYLQEEYRRRPDDTALYDLVVNTGVIGLDNAIDLILLALQYKAARLSVQTSELGPVTGLPPYPGHPGDIHPSKSSNG